MPSYPLLQVDAFTSTPLGGNPCAVVFDCPDLSDSTLLAIAREMNLSETAFVWQLPDGRFRARYFTPAEEIPLAGHPTIATAFALMESGRLSGQGKFTLPLVLRDGPVEVEILAPAGRVQRVMMTQRKPRFLRTYSPAQVCPAFGLQPEDLLPGAVIQTVSTGTPQLMIPLRGQAALRRTELNLTAYAALRAAGDFFSPHLFCLGGVEKGATFARHFGLPPDTLEDPFTGSATGGMAAYLWHYGLLKESSFWAEQGHWMNRPGLGWVEVIGPSSDIEAVRVGGAAVLVMRASLMI